MHAPYYYIRVSLNPPYMPRPLELMLTIPSFTWDRELAVYSDPLGDNVLNERMTKELRDSYVRKEAQRILLERADIQWRES